MKKIIVLISLLVLVLTGSVVFAWIPIIEDTGDEDTGDEDMIIIAPGKRERQNISSSFRELYLLRRLGRNRPLITANLMETRMIGRNIGKLIPSPTVSDFTNLVLKGKTAGFIKPVAVRSEGFMVGSLFEVVKRMLGWPK